MGAQASQQRLDHPVRVVLVGGGHANVQVLKKLSEAFVIDQERGFQLTLISDQRFAFYSGMLPGCVSGLYRVDEIQIDLEDLSSWYSLQLAPTTTDSPLGAERPSSSSQWRVLTGPPGPSFVLEV